MEVAGVLMQRLHRRQTARGALGCCVPRCGKHEQDRREKLQPHHIFILLCASPGGATKRMRSAIALAVNSAGDCDGGTYGLH